MNRYKMRYIEKVVRERPDFPECLREGTPSELLRFLGLFDLLTPQERLEVGRELMSIDEAERFIDEHKVPELSAWRSIGV